MLLSALIDKNEPPHIKSIKIGNVVPISDKILPTGDVWLACSDANLIIERKTPPDLLASIADGRLLDQCARMTNSGPWSYLVVTGYLSVKSGQVVSNVQVTQWSARSVQGALLTVQELGVEIVYCDGDADFAATLLWLANRKRDAIKIQHQRRDAVLQSAAEMLLCALPGISEKRAGDLLAYSGSAAWALNYLTEDDDAAARVPGIGPATRANVCRALGLKDGEILAVIDKAEYYGKGKSNE